MDRHSKPQLTENPLPHVRVGASVELYKQEVHVFGGINDIESNDFPYYHSTVLTFDYSKQKWRTRKAVEESYTSISPRPFHHAASTVFKDKMGLCGGIAEGDHWLSEAWVYYFGSLP